MVQALIDFCEESLRRFPREDQLMTENRRRALGGAYFDAGLTEKAGELFRSWLGADPGWGWGWIGWADCYLAWGGRPADFGRAEKLLRRGYRVPGVRDRADIAERLKEVCEDTGRPDEARQYGDQARRLRHEPVQPAARPTLSPGDTARKVGRNVPCPCGSGQRLGPQRDNGPSGRTLTRPPPRRLAGTPERRGGGRCARGPPLRSRLRQLS
jgi:tetratricopeptide (TPR) repeat protein